MASSHARTPVGGAVVIGSLSPATRTRLGQATSGDLSRISDSPPMLLVEADDDPRSLCLRLNAVVGTEGLVAPVLADADGNRLFPTGRLQVRFKELPADDWLSGFAQRYDVDLIRRNKWAPQQAEFAVRPAAEAFLPDIAAAMAKDAAVLAAWPDAKAAFRRG